MDTLPTPGTTLITSAASSTPAIIPPILCPKCHVPVKSGDYFCSNCGTNLHPAPPSISIGSQLLLYLGSLLLPPMGIIWGFRYLRQPDSKSKAVGLIAMILTIVILVITVQVTVGFINTVNEQVNQKVGNFQGF
jgi:hypothetical protein